MASIIGYMAHDVLGNCEGQVEDFSDPSVLAAAEAAGVVFVAVYDDGHREIVKAADVTEPQPRVCGVDIAGVRYVDMRTEATVAALDALAQVVDPGATVEAASETGEDGTATADPVETFKAALEALRALLPEAGDD